MGVGAGEDGLKDASEVEGVEGRGEGRGDDCAGRGQVFFGGVELSSLYTINLQIHPPHPREAQHKPEDAIFDCGAKGYILQEDEVENGDEDDKGGAHAEEENV